MSDMRMDPGRNGDSLGSAASVNGLTPISLIREKALSAGIYTSDLDTSLISHDLLPQLAENITIQSPLLGSSYYWRYLSHVWGLLDSATATTATLPSSWSCRVYTL